MQIPSRADWGAIDEDDLDAKSAFDSFLGKSLSQAEALFQTNALFYQEELQSMPPVPFNFYAPALIKYVTSARAQGDADGGSSFLHLVSLLLKSNRSIMQPDTEHALVSAARQVAERQEFYAADPAIYGHFAELYAEIQQLTEPST